MSALGLVSVLGLSVLFLLAGSDAVPTRLEALNSRVLTDAEAKAAPGMVRAEIRARIRLANQREDQDNVKMIGS